VANDVNYWSCETGSNSGGAHSWIYRGRVLDAYMCGLCSVHVSKSSLKGNTDNA